MQHDLTAVFNSDMMRSLDNRDARLIEVLSLSDEDGYELCFKFFGHIDAVVIEDLQRIGKRWGRMRLMQVSGSSMRWKLEKKSKCKCSSNWYNVIGLLLSYAALVWTKPQRWRP